MPAPTGPAPTGPAPTGRVRRLPDTRTLLRVALVAIPLGVAGNLALTLATTDREVLAALPLVSLRPLLGAAALAFVPWITNALRLQVWMGFVRRPVGFLLALRVYLTSALVAGLLPAAGGGMVKWGLLTRRGLSPGAAASMLTVETVEDVLFFALALPAVVLLSARTEAEEVAPGLYAAGAALRDRLAVALPVAALVLVTLAVGGVVALRGGLGRRVRWRTARVAARARRGVRTHGREARDVLGQIARRGKARFALAMGLTTVQWSTRYGVAVAVLAALGAPPEHALYWVLQLVTYLLMGLVPTPGAVGGAEAAFLLLYRPFVPVAILGLATATWRLIAFYLPMTTAVVLFPVLSARGLTDARER